MSCPSGNEGGSSAGDRLQEGRNSTSLKRQVVLPACDRSICACKDAPLTGFTPFDTICASPAISLPPAHGVSFGYCCNAFIVSSVAPLTGISAAAVRLSSEAPTVSLSVGGCLQAKGGGGLILL